MTDARQKSAESPSPTRAPSLFKTPWIRLVLMAAAVVAILGAGVWIYGYVTVGRFLQSTEDAYVSADFVTVSPRINGTVEAVLVKENQWVEAGQPLVRISGREYRALQGQGLSQVASALADAEGAVAGMHEQTAVIAEAAAQLAAARVDLRHAQAEVDRYAPLAGSGAETDVQYSQLRTQRDKAAIQVQAQEAALRVQQRRLPALAAQRDQALAQAQAARDQVNAAAVDVEATLIRASVAGRVGDLTVRVGQTVQPGVRLLSVVPVQRLYVDARLKETQMGRVRPGQPATITVDALPGARLSGVVESSAPATSAQFALIAPQNATGNFTKVVQRVAVRVRLDAGPRARQVLVPGLSATVTIDTRNEGGAAVEGAREPSARSE